MKRLIALFSGIILCATVNAFALDVSALMKSIDTAKQTIDSTLSAIDKDLKAAAADLSGTDLKSAVARKILNNLLQSRPYVVDCSIIDANGLKITVEPLSFKQYEGASRKYLASVNTLLTTKKPVMSDVYSSAEGIHAVSIGYPIFSPKGDFMGAVRMLIKQGMFLKPLVENEPCKVWVMQTNGLIVYDADSNEIGQNIFTDDMFKPFGDLVGFSRTVALAPTGFGSYNFYADAPNNKTLVQKLAAWDSVGLYGTQWRVIAMEIDRLVPVKKPEAKPEVVAEPEVEPKPESNPQPESSEAVQAVESSE